MPNIDPYLFKMQFDAFKNFVKEKSGVSFVSFASNWYTEKEEGYKYEIQRKGRDALSFWLWEYSEIGNGKIVDAVKNAIEIKDNNLVPWQGRFGKESRPHKLLFEIKNDQKALLKIERCFFKLYKDDQDKESFEEMVDIFGKLYSLIAYLFFLKDRTRYLPIAPRYFDRTFKHFGANFETNQKCSWDNYSVYVSLINELKIMLNEILENEVSLLDAHSFAWMLVAQMESEHKLANVEEYMNLPVTEREAIVKARIGQGKFRDNLIKFWSSCSVTGCSEISLLRASHIKPWAQSLIEEKLSLYNGLLLTPTLDACFDSGYISFDDEGIILISTHLTDDDANVLGIHKEMRMKLIEPDHRRFLAYHRDHIFK